MASPDFSCQSDFVEIGLQFGEDYSTCIRVASTLIALSITSAWFSRAKIKRLSLFFAHWLSGLVLGLGYLVEDMMVTVCWIGSGVEGWMKFMKFFEYAASNMLAITNLAICVNLALIILSHRTMGRVKSVSSPLLISFCLAISTSSAAAVVPFLETAVVHGTGFIFINSDERRDDFIHVSMFYVEFIVGVCMFFIVTWLLVFRMQEIRECWNLDIRIRYYFGLTALGTAVNVGLGICGTLFVIRGKDEPYLVIASWTFRYIQIALDTVVQYGVLRRRHVDERGHANRPPAAVRSSSADASTAMSKRISNPLPPASLAGPEGPRRSSGGGSFNLDEPEAHSPPL